MPEEEKPNETVESTTEKPEVVNLAAEAAKAVETPVKATSSLEQISTDLSPEMLTQVKGLIESSNSSAVNGALEKQKIDFQKQMAAGDYMTPEAVEAKVESRLKLERDKNVAERNLDKYLLNLGIAVDSEDYNKVATAFSEGLEAGIYTHKTLLQEVGVKSIAFAAGVLQAPAPEEEVPPQMGGIAHGAIEPATADYKRGDLDRAALANMDKALGG